MLIQRLFRYEESHYVVLGNPYLATYDVLMTVQPVSKFLQVFYKYEGYG